MVAVAAAAKSNNDVNFDVPVSLLLLASNLNSLVSSC